MLSKLSLPNRIALVASFAIVVACGGSSASNDGDLLNYPYHKTFNLRLINQNHDAEAVHLYLEPMSGGPSNRVLAGQSMTIQSTQHTWNDEHELKTLVFRAYRNNTVLRTREIQMSAGTANTISQFNVTYTASGELQVGYQ